MAQFNTMIAAGKVFAGLAVVALTVSVAQPASAKDNPRMVAFKACAAKTSETLGRGKMIEAKSKRKKSGYAISMTKLNPKGEVLAKVSCKVSKGEVIAFNTDKAVQIAKT